MFWRVVRNMDNTQRQQLLYFATGSASLPATSDIGVETREKEQIYNIIILYSDLQIILNDNTCFFLALKCTCMYIYCSYYQHFNRLYYTYSSFIHRMLNNVYYTHL